MATTSVLSAIQYAQALAQTDSLGIGSVFGLALYNDAFQTETRDLVDRGIDAAQTQESYADLNVPSDPTNGATFPWPLDLYALKTIEINWQDQNPQNYLQAIPMDVANIQNQSFSWLRSNQTQTQPLFDNRGDTFEIFPTPKVSNAKGMRIFYFKTPTEVTDVGQGINYPQTLDYRALSCKMASLYYKSQNDPEMAQVYELEYQNRFNKMMQILAPASQQPIQPQSLHISGWTF